VLVTGAARFEMGQLLENTAATKRARTTTILNMVNKHKAQCNSNKQNSVVFALFSVMIAVALML